LFLTHLVIMLSRYIQYDVWSGGMWCSGSGVWSITQGCV